MATSTLSRPSVHSKGASKRRRGGEPRRPQRWLRLLVTLLVIAALGTAVWLLAFSSVFATNEVAVSKTAVVSSAEVREAAAVPLGLPLARQDLDAVASRIATLRPVESVQVERRWPHTVAVTVTERRPAVAVKQGSGYELVDRFGIAYDSVGKAPDGVATATVQLDNGPVLVAVAEVAGQLPAQLRSALSSVRATTVNDITLTLESKTTIVWGSADQSVLKAQVVQTLLDRKGSYRYLDVSAPHSPAVR